MYLKIIIIETVSGYMYMRSEFLRVGGQNTTPSHVFKQNDVKDNHQFIIYLIIITSHF